MRVIDPKSLMPALALLFFSGVTFAQSDYDNQTLEVKHRFSQRALQALNEPFVGVTNDGSVEPGLFTIRATGVSTSPVVEAAIQFLTTLEPDQKVRSVFSVQDSEWRRWSNVDNGIFLRQGVSLKEMTGKQREAAMDLMRASLSANGLQLSLDIMKTDQTLREINNDILSYDEELYFFTLMGLPSAIEPWGWQLDGHHLIINYFVLGDQVVMTPVFLGGEPVKANSGKYAGNHILQEEQNSGLAMMQALDDEQKASATLASTKKHNNNRGEANKDNLVLEYEGIPVTRFSDEQKTQLLDLIEFDHQFPVGTSRLNKERKPTRDHIHVVIRTPNGNDYGKDLLSQHLGAHPH